MGLAPIPAFGPPPGGWPRGAVIMAVIDDGIAFAHERFRRRNGGSRVEAFWNMNVPFTAIVAAGVLPAPGGLLGELTRPQIDALLAAAATGGVVDEDLVYRTAGLVNHLDPRHKAVAWRLSHGTHVLDLAAGEDPAANVLDRPIIAVQLPTPIVARTIGDYWLQLFIWLAILYILDRADRLAGPGNSPRLVINTSFGFIAGPHDGSGPLERFMDGVIAQRYPDTQIVLPAGNAHLSRCHAEIDFAAENPVELGWMVQPNDRTHSVIEVWLPGVSVPGVNRLRMTVAPPGAAAHVIDETPGALVGIYDPAGKLIGSMLFDTPGGRGMFRLSIWPTDRAQPHPRPVAPSGRWHLTFDPGPAPMGGVAEAWVQRDDSLYGYPQRGRQSYFERPDYVRFDAGGREVCDDNEPAQLATPSLVTRRSLFNAIATGGSTITAGGYLDRDRVIARYSAGGPNTLPGVVKPVALLPSEGSKPHAGVLAAGSRSGARVAMGGTSVAAPRLARFVADRMAAGAAADRLAVEGVADVTDPVAIPPRLPLDRSAGRVPGVLRGVRRYEPG